MSIRQNTKNRIVTTLVVTILLISVVPIIASGSSLGDETYSGDKTVVTYHIGKVSDVVGGTNGLTDSETVSVTYYGVPGAEYNPQFWINCPVGELTKGTLSNWYPIETYSVGSTIVFTGWITEDGNRTIDPGARIDGITNLWATWDTLSEVMFVDGNQSDYDNGRSEQGATSFQDAIGGISGQHGKYRTMILLCGNSGSIVLTDVDKEVTIRSLDSKKTLTYGGPLNISKDVIFDNLRLEGPYRTGDYASTSQYDHSGI